MRIPIRALAAIAIALLSAATVAQALAANPCASAAAHRSPTGGTPSHAETMIDALGDGTRSSHNTSSGAIGGTGTTASGGIGGTGKTASGGIGGTGKTASGGIGGTGRTASGGIGGTGKTASGGIGGTGKTASGGIGGTGKTASGGIGGTGVVGVITGFASICVAGVEVHYADVTPVKIDGVPARVEDLAIGQVVAVVASGMGDSLQAVSVDVVHAVTGPVAAVDASSAVVAGRRVVLGPRDLAVAAQARAQGAALKVSALPGPDGNLQVTRVDLAPADEPARLTGVVTRVGSDQVELDGQRVSLPRALARSLRIDQQVALSGRWRAGRLRVETVAEPPTQAVLTGATRAIVEGFVSDTSATRVRAGGREFRVPSDEAPQSDRVRELRRGERVVVTAESDGKRWRVLRVDVTRARDERERESGRSPIDADPGDGPPSGPREDRGGETDRKGDPARERRKDSVLVDSPVTRRDGDELEEISRTRESGHAEKPGDAEKAAGRVGIDRTDRPEAAPRPERLERPERTERLERPERIERIERIERLERPERIERIERLERLERPDRPERLER